MLPVAEPVTSLSWSREQEGRKVEEAAAEAATEVTEAMEATVVTVEATGGEIQLLLQSQQSEELMLSD